MIYCHTMAKTKIAITLDENLLRRVDRAVEQGRESNRSAAIERAVADFIDRMDRTRLARECAKLVPDSERTTADAALPESAQWPAY